MYPLRTISKEILSTANRLGAIPIRNSIDPREVEFLINNYREQWLIENFKKTKGMYYRVPQIIIQDLGCLVLECADQSECDNLPVGCFVGKVTIPTPASIDGALDYVGVISKRHKFFFTQPNDIAGKLASKYASNFVYYYMIGPTTLYVATMDSKQYFDLCYINVREICADPTKACYKKSLSTPSCCYDPNIDIYPASGEMLADIKMQIFTKDFNIAMHLLADTRDNNRDDRIPQPQNVR